MRTQITNEELQNLGMAILAEEYRRDREGIRFTPADRYLLWNQGLMGLHLAQKGGPSVSPVQLAFGRLNNEKAIKNINISLRGGGEDMLVNYQIVNEQTTATDPATGDPLLRNPLATPTFGASTGIIPAFWMDRMIRDVSRYTMAKNFAMIFPMPAAVAQAPIKKGAAQAFLSTLTPVAEGRAGSEVANAYSLWQIDAYKYKYHSGMTLEVLKVVMGYIEFLLDLSRDMAEAYDLLIDNDYFESQYEAINQGFIRRWNGSAWAFATPIAHGSASVLTTNAPKHTLFFGLTDKKLYTAAVGAGNENKFDSSVLHTDAPTNLAVWDIFPWLAKLLKDKRAKAEYVIIHRSLTPLLAMDSRFTNSQIRAGSFQFDSENGFLGRFNLGGTQSTVDVWEFPAGVLDAKVTVDTTPRAVLPIAMGEYRRSGLIAPWIPFNLTTEKGFEVKTVDGVSVIRENDTEVLTATGHQCVVPWDTNGIVWCKVIREAHA